MLSDIFENSSLGALRSDFRYFLSAGFWSRELLEHRTFGVQNCLAKRITRRVGRLGEF